MHLAVSVAINRGRAKIRQFWLGKRKTGSRKNNDDRRGCRNQAVNKARRLQALQPPPQVAPTRCSKCCRQDRVLQLRRRLNRLQSVQAAQRPRNRRDQRRAPLARVYVEVERGLLGGLKKPIEVIAQARFGLFTSPVHKMLCASFEIPISLTTDALPSVAGCAPVRCVRD